MSLCVVVLLPNGRKQSVAVTPKFSILQILEYICTSNNLNADEYELKHYKETLDLSNTVQFSNLSNNAQLELVKALNVREPEAAVNVGLQLESGQRIIADFPPSISLWNMLNSLDTIKDLITSSTSEEGLVPVCVYMRNEIAGESALVQKTLRSLGIVKGKAMIRLFFRQAETLKSQAFVEVPLAKKLKPEEDETEGEQEAQDLSMHSSARTSQAIAAGQDIPRPLSPYTVERQRNTSIVDQLMMHAIFSHSQGKSQNKSAASGANEAKGRVNEDKGRVNEDKGRVNEAEGGVHEGEGGVKKDEDAVESTDSAEEEEAVILGERRAVLYSLDSVPVRLHEELPDEFYDLTIDDIRYLHEDLVRVRKKYEKDWVEIVEFNNESHQKKFKYKQAVIRIMFPGRLILQGLFDASELVEHVMIFVRKFISDEVKDFYLFTVPPKEILNPKTVLLNASLVPKALVYFGTTESVAQPLKEELCTKLSSPTAANKLALNIRPFAEGDTNLNNNIALNS